MTAAIAPGEALIVRATTARVAVETLVGVVTCAATWAADRRYRASGSLADLFLTVGAASLVIVNVTVYAIPALLEVGADSTRSLASAPGRLLAAALFAAAAFAPRRPMDARTRRLAEAGGGAALIASALGGTAFVLSGHPLGPDPHAPASFFAALRDAPALGVVRCAAAALFAAAALGFARRARATGDGFWGWIALAAALGALSRLNYVVVPSMLDAAWFTTADLLRVASILALGGAVGVELGRPWRRAAESAIATERRRLARNLHDGVAQDLAFIISQSQSLRAAPEADRRVRSITAAAEHALESSRAAIAELTGSSRNSIGALVRERAGELASRWGIALHVDVDEDVALGPGQVPEVLGMVSEAISNAARHGGARNVAVYLRPGPEGRMHLRIADDGQGFEPGGEVQRVDGGFGLVSMRERAVALGGEMRLESGPGMGTRIEVALR